MNQRVFSVLRLCTKRSLSLLGAISSSLITLTLVGRAALPETPVLTSFPVHVTRFKVDQVRPRIYATDITTNNVYVFNTSTLTLEATIPVKGQPRGLAISPDNKRLFVANEKDIGISNPEYVISIIDLDTLFKLTPFYIFDDAMPYDVEDGLDGRLYISTAVPLANGTIDYATGLILDDETGAFIDYFPLLTGDSPSSLEISPDRKTLFSGNGQPGIQNLVKYDVSTSTMSVLQTLDAGNEEITLSHDGSFIC